MPLTVAQAIELPAIQRGMPEIVSACRWGDTIRWAHSSDRADLSTLLQGGELILTTGAALANDPETYLRGLAAAGAVGVVVDPNPAVAELPPGIGAIAERVDLALIVLHREIRFVDVTEAVHRVIVADQYDELMFARHVHEMFTELSMRRVGPDRIVDETSRILNEPVVLEDLAHRALVVSSGTSAELLTDWERRSRLSPGNGGGAEPWAVTGVGPRSQEWGRLAIPREPTAPTRAKMVLERAAAALAMCRMIEQDRSNLQHQAQGGLIDDVLHGRIIDERDVAARAHALGLKISTLYLPAVVRVARPSRVGDPVADHRRNVALLDAIAHTVSAAGHSGLFSLRGDGVVGAVLALRDPRPANASNILSVLGSRLRWEIHRVDGVAKSVLAVGSAEEQLTDAIYGITEVAYLSEAALSLQDTDRPYYRASDVRLRGLISLLHDDPRVQQFAETELKPLLMKDSGGTGLSDLTVLREHLRLAGNKAAVANRLHISRPALYKRLAAVRDLLGLDLDDGESMTSLHVALMILEQQGRKIPGHTLDKSSIHSGAGR